MQVYKSRSRNWKSSLLWKRFLQDDLDGKEAGFVAPRGRYFRTRAAVAVAEKRHEESVKRQEEARAAHQKALSAAGKTEQKPIVQKIRRLSSKKGFVYFIQGKITRLIKIGWSMDARRRIIDIQAASPDQIETLLIVSATYRDEQKTHGKFAEFRAHGEWFRPAQEILDFIARLTTTENSYAEG